MKTPTRIRSMAHLSCATLALMATMMSLPRSANAQRCDQCERPKVASYDFEIAVPKPADSAQIGNWMLLFYGGAGARGALVNEDASRDCITYIDGAFFVNSDGSPSNTIRFGQTYANLPPAGPVSGSDYLLTGRISLTGGTYTMTYSLECSRSREVVKTGSTTYTDPARTLEVANQLAKVNLVPMFTTIREFERKKRSESSAVAISAETITLTPAKQRVTINESVDVELKLLDCDGMPLKGRTISLVQGYAKGFLLAGSVGGQFTQNSVTTDDNGISRATFRAGSRSGAAVMRVYWIGRYAHGDTNIAMGEQTIGVDTPPPDLWKFTLSMETEGEYVRDTTNAGQVSYYHDYSSSSGSAKVVGFFKNEINYIPGVVQFTGASDSIYWPMVTGKYSELALNQKGESLGGVLTSAEKRKDVTEAAATLDNLGFEFYVDSVQSHFSARVSCRGSTKTHFDTFDGTSWAPEDYNLSGGVLIVGSWSSGEPGGSLQRNGRGYSGSFFLDTVLFEPTIYGRARITTITSMRLEVTPVYVSTTGVGDGSVDGGWNGLPLRPTLSQNYPNPFNPSTTIRYSLPRESRVRLVVLNTLGQVIATLADERKQPGDYIVRWSPELPSGVYFYRLQDGEYSETKKMILFK